MANATFTFHGALNFYLPPRQTNTTIDHHFDHRGSVKDMIESLNVPHPEIELIIVNGESVDFDYIVQDSDDIHVYDDVDAVSLPQNDKIPLTPDYPGKPRFVLDTHLGKLAAYLRMLGFDTLYRNDYADDELAAISAADDRILLTRDIGLLKRGIVTYGYFVRQTDPRERLQEINARYNLADYADPFTYCMKCNGRLHPVDKEAIRDQIPADVADAFDEFHQCEQCGQIYWKGSHYERMLTFIEDIVTD